MTWQELLKQSTWIGTFLLIAAFAASRLLRGTPAAWRHFLWTAVLAGLLALPALVGLSPKWRIETAPAPAAAVPETAAIAQSVAEQTAPAPRRWNPLFLAWCAGTALTAGWFLVGRWRIARLVRRGTEAAYARELLDAAGGAGIRVVESGMAGTAMAFGIWRPLVILPAGAGRWPLERLRSALLHELMHVRRFDLAAQAIAQAVCCLYWFHPLTWMAARQMRREREQACDDAVVGRGIAAHDYAGHLVALVRTLRGSHAGVCTMAEPSELESRVRALLDGARDRRPLNRRAAFAMVAALVILLLPAAVITVQAQAAPWRAPEVVAVAADDPAPQAPASVERGALSGSVNDPTGARIPGCQITAKNLDTQAEEVTRSDAAGAYSFAALPVGHYQLDVQAPGFKTFRRGGLAVAAKQTATLNAFLVVGSVSEAMTVTASRPTTAPPAAPVDPRRIRVGGNVQAARLLRRVPPVYPEDLKAQGVTGVVHLAAIIDKQGYLTDIKALGGPEGLVAAAKDAASHWAYQPALLNGEPIAVETMIDIVFELK